MEFDTGHLGSDHSWKQRMARRRTMGAPDAAELARIDAEASEVGFAAKPARARDRSDAAALRTAREEGWEVRSISIAAIHVDARSRDRIEMEAEALDKLRASIRAGGLRTPIEVSQRNTGDGYDLISGLRRLTAVSDVDGPDASIPAFVRPLRDAAETFVAMIEENEIHANLTAYERGRAAVVAVQDGAFATVGEAVDALYAASNKSKRSKVRSFATVHEELGDLLKHPRALTERKCLQLSAAIKAGAGPRIRDALAEGDGRGPSEEWSVLAAAMPPPRGFRSETPNAPQGSVDLGGGRSARPVVDGMGRHSILLEGPVDPGFVATLMDRLRPK